MREVLPRRTAEEELRGAANVSEGALAYARGQAPAHKEKGEQMDDATAKRIAKRLCRDGWFGPLAEQSGTAGTPWGGRLADAIQAAAEAPTPKPGLYFIRGEDGDAKLQRMYVEGNQVEWGGPQDLSRFRPEPDGDIISGPHTCEELLAGVQH